MKNLMPKKLAEYINMELSFSKIYLLMSDQDQNEENRKKFRELAGENAKHADMFSDLYKIMTGYVYQIKDEPASMPESMTAAVHNRVDAEITASKSYYADALENYDKFRLRNAFLRASHDAAMHAVILSHMSVSERRQQQNQPVRIQNMPNRQYSDGSGRLPMGTQPIPRQGRVIMPSNPNRLYQDMHKIPQPAPNCTQQTESSQ